jgi:hypothetical protein
MLLLVRCRAATAPAVASHFPHGHAISAHVRDSKKQVEAVLSFTREQWAVFTAYAREISV